MTAGHCHVLLAIVAMTNMCGEAQVAAMVSMCCPACVVVMVMVAVIVALVMVVVVVVVVVMKNVAVHALMKDVSVCDKYDRVVTSDLFWQHASSSHMIQDESISLLLLCLVCIQRVDVMIVQLCMLPLYQQPADAADASLASSLLLCCWRRSVYCFERIIL